MSEAIKQIVGEFEKPIADIPSDVMDAIKNSRLDLSLNIPNPQMLVSKGDLPVCTRGNFSFVIGLPGARKSFLCSGIAGAFLNEDGCMGLDNPNGTGKLLWIDTEQAPGHVAKYWQEASSHRWISNQYQLGEYYHPHVKRISATYAA